MCLDFVVKLSPLCCSRGMPLRNLLLTALTFSFVMLVYLHGNRPPPNVHLDLDFLYVTPPNDSEVTRDEVLNYQERVKRVMAQQAFRHPLVGHKHGSLWFSKGLMMPWFMMGGEVRPSNARSRNRSIWPTDSSNDRIVDQLMYLPPLYSHSNTYESKLKTIVLHGDWDDFKQGRQLFTRNKCPVDRCQVFRNETLKNMPGKDVDAMVFKDYMPDIPRTDPQQIWILHLLESPMHISIAAPPGVINWAATYRSDSVIVTPYAKFVLFDPLVKQLPLNGKNFAKGKKKMVAWFVSNCFVSKWRLEYANELGKHVQVDIYGQCGTLKCDRHDQKRCLDMLDKDYKFYLSFENANCKDYITEKFYNALWHDVVPIVMGASPDEYRKAAPFHSYIHVDDFESPKDLARYLKVLDSNSTLYSEYFAWKGTGEFINTFFWCRLCALLHAPLPPSQSSNYYEDVGKWWHHGTCRTPKHGKKRLVTTSRD
ncbi:glycoprotein 3-alpha-L-fucosyltransferase A-like [Ornithodoros turicata]|uniref:glycoprotein 3-alpha-L-fucosyltransferase A-like n=1 Tax=Ornithodoros turicata TaxID=34597 RepID=UPI0031390690